MPTFDELAGPCVKRRRDWIGRIHRYEAHKRDGRDGQAREVLLRLFGAVRRRHISGVREMLELLEENPRTFSGETWQLLVTKCGEALIR